MIKAVPTLLSLLLVIGCAVPATPPAIAPAPPLDQEALLDGWFDDDYLGIDQGPIVLMIENYRTGFVWEVMKKNPHIVRGLQRAGFRGGWLEAVQ